MDKDTIELARRLCTKAGMIMEDASAVAVLSMGDATDLRRKAEELKASIQKAAACIEAAKALLG